MGHNSMEAGHPKSIGIPRVDRLSTRPPDLGCHRLHLFLLSDARECEIVMHDNL